MQTPLWKPSAERIKNSNLTDLMTRLKEQKGLDFKSYDELYEWSVAERADFWESVWEYGGIISSKGYDEVLVDGDKMPGAKWFTGARLNFAENLLRFRDQQEALKEDVNVINVLNNALSLVKMQMILFSPCIFPENLHIYLLWN
jgi:acetoacetyl-CoA synthetase